MSIPHVPHLAEVARVGEDKLYAYSGAADLMDAMTRSGIWCHEDEAENYWFGSDAPEIPEHDRWLYLLTRQEQLRGGYLAGRFRVLGGCDTGLRSVQGMGDLVDEIQDLARQRSHTMTHCGLDADQAERQRLARNFLIASRELGRRSPVNMVAFVRAPWNQELHEIVRHWDAWSELNNPDGMPRDLVLRLYGLSTFADELKTGTQHW